MEFVGILLKLFTFYFLGKSFFKEFMFLVNYFSMFD